MLIKRGGWVGYELGGNQCNETERPYRKREKKMERNMMDRSQIKVRGGLSQGFT